MKIALFGKGKMGEEVARAAPKEGMEIFSSLSRNESPCLERLKECGAFIDFSSKEAVFTHLQLAIALKKPIVIGTTGWEDDMEKAKTLVLENKAAALYSPNFSIGMAHFLFLLKCAKKLLSSYDVAGFEIHHRGKKDAPSGTAKVIAKELEINEFASVRCGSFIGKHEVLFDSALDTICISHTSKGREAYAKGALLAAKWLDGKIGWYTLDDLFGSLYGAHHTL